MAAKKPTFTVTVDEEFLAVLTSIKDSLDKLASGNVAVATPVIEVPAELKTEPMPATLPATTEEGDRRTESAVRYSRPSTTNNR